MATAAHRDSWCDPCHEGTLDEFLRIADAAKASASVPYSFRSMGTLGVSRNACSNARSSTRSYGGRAPHRQDERVGLALRRAGSPQPPETSTVASMTSVELGEVGVIGRVATQSCAPSRSRSPRDDHEPRKQVRSQIVAARDRPLSRLAPFWVLREGAWPEARRARRIVDREHSAVVRREAS